MNNKIITFEPKLYVPAGYEGHLNKEKEKPLSFQRNISLIELTSRLQAAKAVIGDTIENFFGTNYLVTEKGWVKVSK